MISYKDIALQIYSYSSQADYNCYQVIAHFVPNFVAIATRVGGRKCNWQYSMAHFRKSLYKRKHLADISYTDWVLSQILLHGNGCRSENMQFAAFNGLSLKPPRCSRKNLADVVYTSWVIANFVSNFVGITTAVSQGKCNWQHSMAHSWNIFPPIGLGAKISQKFFYASRIIANFVPNFIAMATGVSRGKMQLAAFDGPSPKTPFRRKNLSKISYASQLIAHFVPNFVAMATGIGRKKMQLTAFDGPSLKTFL